MASTPTPTRTRWNGIAVSILAEIIHHHRSQKVLQVVPATAEALDPVCGMMVEVATAKYTSVRDGQTIYFCCRGCRDTFDAGA